MARNNWTLHPLASPADPNVVGLCWVCRRYFRILGGYGGVAGPFFAIFALSALKKGLWGVPGAGWGCSKDVFKCVCLSLVMHGLLVSKK